MRVNVQWDVFAPEKSLDKLEIPKHEIDTTGRSIMCFIFPRSDSEKYDERDVILLCVGARKGKCTIVHDWAQEYHEPQEK